MKLLEKSLYLLKGDTSAVMLTTVICADRLLTNWHVVVKKNVLFRL